MMKGGKELSSEVTFSFLFLSSTSSLCLDLGGCFSGIMILLPWEKGSPGKRKHDSFFFLLLFFPSEGTV